MAEAHKQDGVISGACDQSRTASNEWDWKNGGPESDKLVSIVSNGSSTPSESNSAKDQQTVSFETNTPTAAQTTASTSPKPRGPPKLALVSSSSFNELEDAIGAQLALNLTMPSTDSQDNFSPLPSPSPNNASRLLSTDLTQLKVQQQQQRQRQQQNTRLTPWQQAKPFFGSNPISAIHIANCRAELQTFIQSEPSRAMILFHSPQITPQSIIEACSRFGVLYYIRPEFHNRGLTLLSYCDSRSAEKAKTSVAEAMGAAAEASVHYSIMIHNEEFKLVLGNVPENVTSAEIESVSSSCGQVKSIEKVDGSLYIRDRSGTESSTGTSDSGTNIEKTTGLQNSNMCTFLVEYFNVLDARSAPSELASLAQQQLGPSIFVRFAPLSERIHVLFKQLLATLSRWRTESISPPPSTASLALQAPSQAAGGIGLLGPPSPLSPGLMGILSGYTTQQKGSVQRAGADGLLQQHGSLANNLTTTTTATTRAPPIAFAPASSASGDSEDDASRPVIHYYEENGIESGESQRSVLARMQPDSNLNIAGNYQQQIQQQQQQQQWQAMNQQPYFGSTYTQSPQSAQSISFPPSIPPPQRAHAPPLQPYSEEQQPYGFDRNERGGQTVAYPQQGLANRQQQATTYYQNEQQQQQQQLHQQQEAGSFYQQQHLQHHQQSHEQQRHGKQNSHSQFQSGGRPGPSSNNNQSGRASSSSSGSPHSTTIMVRNIPNKYSQQMLLDEINVHFAGTYDFFYLPIDFKNRCNVGYCFVNFIEREPMMQFIAAFNGQRWKNFNSEKVCAVSYARIQGKVAMISRFQNSSLLEKDDAYQPLLFYSSGPLRGQPEPFPTNQRHYNHQAHAQQSVHQNSHYNLHHHQQQSRPQQKYSNNYNANGFY